MPGEKSQSLNLHYLDSSEMPPRTANHGPSPGETGAPSAATSNSASDYAVKGAKIKERYGKQATTVTPVTPAPTFKYHDMTNTYRVMQKFLPENTDRMINDLIQRGIPPSQAQQRVGRQYANEMAIANHADGIRYDQINQHDISASAAAEVLRRHQQNSLNTQDIPGGQLTAEQQAKLKKLAEDEAAKAGANAAQTAKHFWKYAEGRDLPEKVEFDPPKMETVDMPGEVDVVDAPAAKGKQPAQEEPAVPKKPYVGFGDVRQAERQLDTPKTLSMKSPAEEEDDLGAKLRAGAKAWNAEKLANEDVGE